MEENSSQKPQDKNYKIPVIRTYEHDIEEAIAQKKISSARISIAESDGRRKNNSSSKPAAPTVAPTPFLPPEKIAPKPPEISNTATYIPSRIEPPEPIVIEPTPPAPRIIAPRPPRTETKSRSGMPGILKLLTSLVLIAAGIYGGYYLFSGSSFGKELLAPAPTETPVAENTIIPSIITPDTQKTVDITGLTGQEILSAVEQKAGITNVATIPSGTSTPVANPAAMTGMIGLVLEETDSGLTSQVTAPEFIGKIGMTPPDTFASSLNDSWMIGSDNGAPFIVFTSNFFQNTFAGMLAWEPTLPENLSALFGFDIGTTGRYEDRILDNKNIREFVGTNGAPIFLYGFMDNSTLVIARNERTFSDIVARIEKETYVR